MNHHIVPLSAVSADAVETLLDRAFGADRHTRTAYRIRAGTDAIGAFSFAAIDDGEQLLGSIQSWPIQLESSGRVIPMTMVGPVAVDPRWQQAGLGRQLMAHMLDAAAGSAVPGADALMLIGDFDYYGRFFGFSADATGEWEVPGPVERDRLLARGAGVQAIAGRIGPRLV